MNSSNMSMTKSTSPSVEAQPPFTWIERFALPLAVSSMEAQPIALVIAFLTLLVSGPKTAPPFGAGVIALVALGLLWWAMSVEHIIRQRFQGKRPTWLHLLSWLIAILAVVGPRLPSALQGEGIPAVLLGVALVTWFWRRGRRWAQTGFEYGHLSTSFKVGFGVLLGILVIVVVFPAAELQTLRAALAGNLPTFFLCGLVGLSLARLGAIRNARRTLDGSQADPTRSWLLALTLLGVTLIALVIAIEAIFSFASFELVVSALTPLWNALGTLIDWVLYGIIFLFAPVFYLVSFLIGLLPHQAPPPQQPQNTGPKKSPFQVSAVPQTIPPEVLTLGRWIFLLVMMIVVFMVVRASLRRRFLTSANEEVEEVREGLDARSLLGEHWRGWWNRRRRLRSALIPLEPLDPGSARARYRELLQALATEKDDLARAPAETPAEYEARLLVRLGNAAPNTQELPSGDRRPPDRAILDELTRAYANERYGGKLTLQHQRARLQSWVPHLVARLTGRASPRRSRS